jgi:hypothetical protein
MNTNEVCFIQTVMNTTAVPENVNFVCEKAAVVGTAIKVILLLLLCNNLLNGLGKPHEINIYSEPCNNKCVLSLSLVSTILPMFLACIPLNLQSTVDKLINLQRC